MPVIAKKSKAVHPALNSFRFSHRGAKDYAGLLQHYRTTFKMPQPFVVRLTGFSPRSVAKWREGVLPSPKQEKALVEMDRLLDGLARVMKPAQVGHWLKSPTRRSTAQPRCRSWSAVRLTASGTCCTTWNPASRVKFLSNELEVL